jgi:hypothetical protein
MLRKKDTLGNSLHHGVLRLVMVDDILKVSRRVGCRPCNKKFLVRFKFFFESHTPGKIEMVANIAPGREDGLIVVVHILLNKFGPIRFRVNFTKFVKSCGFIRNRRKAGSLGNRENLLRVFHCCGVLCGFHACLFSFFSDFWHE